MIIKIIGMIIGALVLIGGIYYLVKERKDKESLKIYGVITAMGGAVFLVALILIIMEFV